VVSVGTERLWALQATRLLTMFVCVRSTQTSARCSVVTGLIGNGVMLIRLTSWGITHRTAQNALMQDHVRWKTKFVTSIKLAAYTSVTSMLKSNHCSLMQFTLKVLGHLLAWVFDVWIENEMTCVDNVRASYMQGTNRIFLVMTPELLFMFSPSRGTAAVRWRGMS